MHEDQRIALSHDFHVERHVSNVEGCHGLFSSNDIQLGMKNLLEVKAF
jgi:hypothetical protein